MVQKAHWQNEGPDILHGFFSEVMIDAIDLFFIKHTHQQFIQLMRAFQIMSEWFFDHDAV